MTSSADPSLYGQAVTFTATVSPTDGGGTVGFAIDGATIAGCAAEPLDWVGDASCTTSSTGQAGDRTVSATYRGDTAYEGSTGTLTQTVLRIATTVTAAPAILDLSSFTAYAFTLNATLTNAATGAAIGPGATVIFSAFGMPLGVGYTNSAGVASLSITGNLFAVLAIVEMDGFTAIFGGTSTYSPSYGSGPLVAF